MAVAMAAMIFRIIDAVCFPLSLIGFGFGFFVFGFWGRTGRAGIVKGTGNCWVERRQGGACPTLPLSPFHTLPCYPFTFSPFYFLPFYLFTLLPFLTFLSRCFLRVVECHAYGVLGQLLHLAAREQCAHAGLVLLYLRLGLEEYVHRLHVVLGVEGVGGVCRLG